jgi:protein phosphatase
LLLLADGMGGHILGEVAATIAIQTISGYFQNQAQPGFLSPERFFEESFVAAHNEIQRYKTLHNLSETPRTTIVACLIQHGKAFWAHCGDSRLYWIRNGQILLHTKDHSRIETLISQGVVAESLRSTHPDRNKLFNCLGAPIDPIVDTSQRVTLQSGDVILLCSDGVWSALPEDVICQQFRDHTIVRAVPEILAKAVGIAGKSADNATALAMMWEGGGEDIPSISTNTLPIGLVTTTIQSTILQSEQEAIEAADGFNESDIEKAIEEIRNAIQKSSRINIKSIS